MSPTEIKEVCRHLRAKAPQEWEDFVNMFNDYTAEVIDAVTEADASEIMTMKGRALANKAWLKTFLTLDQAPSQQPSQSAPATP
jgi:hypothetical protein